MTSLLLFDAQSLRLTDHPAVRAAASAGDQVVPVFVFDPKPVSRPLGGAALWWLHHALGDLDGQLRALGSRLVIRCGPWRETVQAVAEEVGPTALFMTRAYDGAQADQQAALHDSLSEKGVKVRRFGGHILFEPEMIATKEGKPYTVFSPFWRNCLGQDLPARPVAAPDRLTPPDSWPDSAALDSLGLLPTQPDWAGGMRGAWEVTRDAALARLNGFLGGAVMDYKPNRDRPDLDSTSALSPFMRFGQLGIREVFWAARDKADADPDAAEGCHKFIAELGWREFAAHLTAHFPDMSTKPLRPTFAHFPWEQGPSPVLAAWQKGQTGYPIVDAGMRQLWQTGWMHNRVRMIVASFLVKDLLWHWRDGEDWFWDTLVDADLATNAASWQWAAGCGADAAPYFRIFNPIAQGEKFDADGTYVRRWVPELRELPAKYIHKPWEAEGLTLRGAGVILGKTYPHPIVDRKEARARALAAFDTIKAKPGPLSAKA